MSLFASSKLLLRSSLSRSTMGASSVSGVQRSSKILSSATTATTTASSRRMSTLQIQPQPSLIFHNSSASELWQGFIWLIKRTFQPSIIRKKRKTGFLVRQRTVGGRRTLNRRKAKGRMRLGGGI